MSTDLSLKTAQPAKCAALHIAALSARDRAWIITRLRAGELKQLAPYLEELKRIHPGDLRIALDAIQDGLPETRSEDPDETGKPADRSGLGAIRNASSADLRAVRSELPAAAGVMLDRLLASNPEVDGKEAADQEGVRRRNYSTLLAAVVEERLADGSPGRRASFEALLQRPVLRT
ncbi:MAG: hypothetical protein EPN72_00490 [Nevskiaceae bacterium]|nr:MAG: hypothetical protein EPN63_09715 [Nevskiaceae bacterium]TBR75143.1 MAG: hypothetical protein EPN72_00490 [Nevskiaceae bacterium]